jgi:hypothetical protein
MPLHFAELSARLRWMLYTNTFAGVREADVHYR